MAEGVFNTYEAKQEVGKKKKMQNRKMAIDILARRMSSVLLEALAKHGRSVVIPQQWNDSHPRLFAKLSKLSKNETQSTTCAIVELIFKTAENKGIRAVNYPSGLAANGKSNAEFARTIEVSSLLVFGDSEKCLTVNVVLEEVTAGSGDSETTLNALEEYLRYESTEEALKKEERIKRQALKVNRGAHLGGNSQVDSDSDGDGDDKRFLDGRRFLDEEAAVSQGGDGTVEGDDGDREDDNSGQTVENSSSSSESESSQPFDRAADGNPLQQGVDMGALKAENRALKSQQEAMESEQDELRGRSKKQEKQLCEKDRTIQELKADLMRKGARIKELEAEFQKMAKKKDGYKYELIRVVQLCNKHGIDSKCELQSPPGNSSKKRRVNSNNKENIPPALGGRGRDSNSKVTRW